MKKYFYCSVWGCGPGRPWDNAYTLNKVLKTKEYIKLFIDENQECVIYSPSGISAGYSSQRTYIVIKNADRITWKHYYCGKEKTKENIIEEEYTKIDSRRIHKSSKGSEAFFTYERDMECSENAFELSSSDEVGEDIMNIADFLKSGSTIVSISRVGDLIKLDFLTDDGLTCLHVKNALMRGLKKDKLLISSFDLVLPSKNYKKKLFKKFKWSIPDNSLIDDQLHDFNDGILNKKILSVEMNGKDLILNFEDNYKIEILDFTLELRNELFRISKKGALDNFMIIET